MVQGLIEIRWHARGGQGAVTAAKTLAEMALTKNMFFQAFPEYGPERMGAPIQCFNRLSPNPISTYCGISQPDIVVVVDPSLLDMVDITAGVPEKGIVIINSGEDPKTLKDKYNLKNFQVYTIDATTISMEELGRSMPNIPVLGALLSIIKLLSKEDAVAFVEQSFSQKFPEKVVKSNIRALERAFEEVKGV